MGLKIRDTAIPAGVLPSHDGHFYGGGWHAPRDGKYEDTSNPANGMRLGRFAVGSSADVDAAVVHAVEGFKQWKRVIPRERARLLREIANVIRKNAKELAQLDALDNGSPYRSLIDGVAVAAARFDYYAGLVTEIKGYSVPMGEDVVNFTMRQPFGVVGRIVAFNHPFMFTASKMAAPLASGNAIIVKPPEQAPLSGLRLAELIGDMLPAGAMSILTGGREVGHALALHKDVRIIGLVGSIQTGRAVMEAAAKTIKPVAFELGGKNALIAFPDADPETVAAAAAEGMNLTWCGQSCGSTSRIFLHESIYDRTLAAIKQRVSRFVPGRPDDPATSMGCLVSKVHYERVKRYIAIGIDEGAELVCGGDRPKGEEFDAGFFLEPTVFANVRSDMTIAQEEIFGPVMSVLKWSDEETMLREVNALEYGLTCSIWTNDLGSAHRTAAAVESGYVWVNEVSKHFTGAPFGGMKQSGIGREECIDELLAYTEQKNVHIRWKAALPDR